MSQILISGEEITRTKVLVKSNFEARRQLRIAYGYPEEEENGASFSSENGDSISDNLLDGSSKRREWKDKDLSFNSLRLFVSSLYTSLTTQRASA